MDWLLWVDIETTGLEPEHDVILEIACVLTNFSNDKYYFVNNFVIHQSKEILDSMNEWCKTKHNTSNLVQRVMASTLTEREVEEQIIMSINHHVKVVDTVYIAGNSVHFDKSFIKHHMPSLYNRLSHRIVDISSIAILCKNLARELYENRPTKQYTHTATQDIFESMEEYKYYKKVLIKK